MLGRSVWAACLAAVVVLWAEPAAAGDQPCCDPVNTPGCADPAVEACVCAIDDFCCTSMWHSGCQDLAKTECGLVCTGGGSTLGCCEAMGQPGCNDPTVEACVCDAHPDCCSFWNGDCVYWAQTQCGQACGSGAKGSCCSAHVSGGCEDPTVEACVCGLEPACCNEWTASCAELAETQCSAGCGPASPCCVPDWDRVGCDADPTIEGCVCDIFPNCCTGNWTGACAKMAREQCGAYCPPGPCCEGHDGLGCDEPAVQSCVCNLNATCCTQGWDFICADQASTQCGACAELHTGACCEPHAGPGCADPAVTQCVCAQDATCCSVLNSQWDSQCVTLAEGCGAPCGPPKGPCCEAGPAKGCTDASVEACVCQKRPECCSVGWSPLCATVAELCGADCAPPPAPKGDCCRPSPDAAGCIEPAVESCVCSTRPACCTERWDAACAVLAATCDGVCFSVGEFPCCDEHASPGCVMFPVEACVCDALPACCAGPWTAECVAQAEACGAVCTLPGCCDTSTTPGGCADATVADCVCDQDPWCCSHAWDAGCVTLAHACGAGCLTPAAGEGPCLEANGSPGCSDDVVEACVCDFEAFCCDTDWDSGCADLAVALCQAEVCGDGQCSPGEDCLSCAADCACAAGTSCTAGVCLPDDLFVFGGAPAPVALGTFDDALCPAPSAFHCTDPAFLDRLCGRLMLEGARQDASHPCHEHARQAGEAVGGALQTSGETVTAVRPTLYGTSALVAYRPDSALSVTQAVPDPWEGDAPVVSRATPWAAYAPATEAFIKGLWDINGAGVSACEEYLYEKHWDWHQFEDGAAALAGDYRAIFDLAYGPLAEAASVATRTLDGDGLRRRSGQPAEAVDITEPRAKSPFFEIPTFLYVALSEHATFNADLWLLEGDAFSGFAPPKGPQIWARVRQGMPKTDKGFAWHRQMSDTLAAQGHDDGELLSYEPIKDRYRQLVQAAEYALQALALARGAVMPEVVTDHQQHLAAISGLEQDVPSTFDNQASPEQIAALEALAERRVDAVVEAIVEADALGCLTLEANPCDWSPRDFVQQLQRHPPAGRDQDLERCREETGSVDFASLDGYAFTPIGDKTYPDKDYTADTVALEQFFVDHRQWLIDVANHLASLGLTTEDGQPRTGKSIDEMRRKSDDWFGYDYDYHFAWDIVDLAISSAQDNVSDIRAAAGIWAEGRALGKRIPLIAADLTINGTRPGSEPSALGIEVLGVQLFDDAFPIEIPQDWNFVEDSYTRAEEYEFDGPVFPIAGVPVRISGGLGGVIEVQTDVDVATPIAEVHARLDASIRPVIEVYGFLSAAVDYTVVRAGVRGEVVVLGLDLPLTLHAFIGLEGLDVIARLESTADLVLRALDGRFKLFAEIDVGVWKERYDKTIASWRGIRHDSRLFGTSLTIPILGLIEVCQQQGIVECPASE